MEPPSSSDAFVMTLLEVVAVVWGLLFGMLRTFTESTESKAGGRTARRWQHRSFVVALLGLLYVNGASCQTGRDIVAPHALRAGALCAAAHQAELGVEAALVKLVGLPSEERWRSVQLRDEAESSLAKLEAEWAQTSAWIDAARRALAFASPAAHPLASSPRRRLLQTDAITNANIRAAAAEWLASPTTAAAKYGPIAAWNTAGVASSMLQLFANATTFNEDLSQWNVACVTSMREMFLGAAAFDGN